MIKLWMIKVARIALAGMLALDVQPADERRPLRVASLVVQEPADQGYSPAQFSIGWMHEFGKGVSKEYEKAIDWYEQGDVEAQYNLGMKYALGQGVPQDNAKAFKIDPKTLA